MNIFTWFKKKPIIKVEHNEVEEGLVKKKQRVMERLKNIIDKFPFRLSGSKTNYECANYIKGMFDPFCNEVNIDTFYDSPIAFRKWPYLVIMMYSVTVALLWSPMAWLAILPLFLALAISFRAGYLSRASFKLLFGRQRLHNVIATNSKEKNSKTIIFSSHFDSAPILRITKYNKKIMTYFVISSFVVLLFGFVFMVIMLLLNIEYKYPAIIFSALFPVVLSLTLLTGGTQVSKGAGDNMVSVSMLVELAQYFKENPLDNTNIIFASFDGEETGLLGSNYYYNQNELVFANSDCININLDSLFSVDELAILLTDINGSIKLDKTLSLDIITKAKEMGYSIKSENMALFAGATDAASAMRYGIPSATIIGCNPDTNISHSEDDIPENIDIDVIGVVLEVIIKVALGYDSK